ncbi:MAG: hypothetical protein AB2689_23390, partial [Candidatus Thiodiazotropha taylori]
MISGECFSTDHQSILPGLASRYQCSEPFTVFLHPFLLLALRRVWRRRRSSRRGGCQWSPLSCTSASALRRQQLIYQFVTVHFARCSKYRYYKPAGLSNTVSKAPAEVKELPSNEKQRN